MFASSPIGDSPALSNLTNSFQMGCKKAPNRLANMRIHTWSYVYIHVSTHLDLVKLMSSLDPTDVAWTQTESSETNYVQAITWQTMLDSTCIYLHNIWILRVTCCDFQLFWLQTIVIVVGFIQNSGHTWCHCLGRRWPPFSTRKHRFRVASKEWREIVKKVISTLSLNYVCLCVCFCLLVVVFFVWLFVVFCLLWFCCMFLRFFETSRIVKDQEPLIFKESLLCWNPKHHLESLDLPMIGFCLEGQQKRANARALLGFVCRQDCKWCSCFWVWEHHPSVTNQSKLNDEGSCIYDFFAFYTIYSNIYTQRLRIMEPLRGGHVGHCIPSTVTWLFNGENGGLALLSFCRQGLVHEHWFRLQCSLN